MHSNKDRYTNRETVKRIRNYVQIDNRDQMSKKTEKGTQIGFSWQMRRTP